MKAKSKKVDELDRYIKSLTGLMKRKVIGDPEGLDPPNLSTLIDRARYACEKPGLWTSIYTDNLKEDIKEARHCIVQLEYVVGELEQYLLKRKLSKKKKCQLCGQWFVPGQELPRTLTPVKKFPKLKFSKLTKDEFNRLPKLGKIRFKKSNET